MIRIDRLTERLSALGVTANAASEDAGLGRSYVRDILRGRIKAPSAIKLMQLARVLQTTPAYLLGRESVDGEEWMNALPDADDRDFNLIPDAIEAYHSVKERGDPKIVLMLQVLDQVNDFHLITQVYKFVFAHIFLLLKEEMRLDDQDATIVLGDRAAENEDTFLRLAILAKYARIIDPLTYSAFRVFARVRPMANKEGDSFVLNEDVAELILGVDIPDHLKLTDLTRETMRIFFLAVLVRSLTAESAWRHGKAPAGEGGGKGPSR